MTQYIVGIDPGKTGGMVVLPGPDKPIITHVMPETIQELSELLAQFKGTKCHFFLEHAQAMPKNGVVSMFKYGQHFGEIIGALAALRLPHTLIKPTTWTKEMHQGTNKSDLAKTRSYVACRRLFPEVDLLATVRSKKPHEGLIDALLIAEYGRRVIARQNTQMTHYEGDGCLSHG